MAVITGITGSIAWVGGNNAQLAATGCSGQAFSINMECEEFDATAFATTGARDIVKGLRSWEGEFTAMLISPDHGGGTNGAVTFADGYAANLNAWDLTLTRDALESTAFAATARTFFPGLYGWGGNFSGFYDDTTVAIHPGVANEPSAATFQYQEQGANDAAFTGSILTTRGTVEATPAQLNRIAYAFTGDGVLTHSATTGEGILVDGALTPDSAGQLTLTASTGQTFVGDAFWTSVNIACRVGALTVVRVGFQGTGALTIA